MTKGLVEALEKIREMPKSKRRKIKLVGKRPLIETTYSSRFGGKRVWGVGYLTDIHERKLSIRRYYLSEVSTVKGISGFEVPIGAYGKRLAFATTMAARATAALLNSVQSQITPAGHEYDEALQATFQKNIKGAQIEGVQTLAGQFALLSISKVPGYRRKPTELFRQLRKQGILNAWAAHAEFGATAPQFNGRSDAIWRPLNSSHGKLKLSSQTKDNLRSKYHKQVDGCPVARANTPIERKGHREVIPDSGINLLADMFGQFLAYYYKKQVSPVGRFVLGLQEHVPGITLK